MALYQVFINTAKKHSINAMKALMERTVAM